MSRKSDILKLLNNDIKYIPLVDEMLFLENQLEALRKLPMIKVNPNNPEQQRKTPASILYKENLQQYMNIVRILMKATGSGEEESDSLLKDWLKRNGISEG
jgi:hypothetical protein